MTQKGDMTMEPVKEAIKLPEACDQCPNHCKATELKCGRGHAYFERLKNGETPFHSENPLAEVLVRCGELVKYKGERMQQHGDDIGMLFEDGLTAQEREQLLALLQKQYDFWQQRHYEAHKNGHPHGPHGPHGPHDGHGPHGPHDGHGPHGPHDGHDPHGPHGYHGPQGE
jgi:hypothetical protein